MLTATGPAGQLPSPPPSQSRLSVLQNHQPGISQDTCRAGADHSQTPDQEATEVKGLYHGVLLVKGCIRWHKGRVRVERAT